MGSIFPTYPKGIMTPVKGVGSWLWDDQGKKYLDLTSGIGVNQLGHAPEAVKNQVIEQLEKLWHTSNLFTIPSQEKLAEELTKLSGLDYAFFSNSGAEANEAAIKIARRYQQKLKKTKRYQVITFQQSFHGRTLATLTATGQAKVKDGFSPLPEGFITVPYGEIEPLKAAINENTAAIMLEVIQGEGGVVPADANWLKSVEKLAKERDILLIIDEIQTGMGRTGKWFGFQQYQLEPDIITIAKGLANGFPIGAMLATEKTKEAFNLGSHGSTFGGNFIVTTAALATIQTISDQGILSHVTEMGPYLFEKIEKKFAKYEEFVEIRGKGLMVGIEWRNKVSDLVTIARDEGLLVLTAGENVVRLLPSLNISKEEIDIGLEKLERSVVKWRDLHEGLFNTRDRGLV